MRKSHRIAYWFALHFYPLTNQTFQKYLRVKSITGRKDSQSKLLGPQALARPHPSVVIPPNSYGSQAPGHMLRGQELAERRLVAAFEKDWAGLASEASAQLSVPLLLRDSWELQPHEEERAHAVDKGFYRG